MKKCFIEVVIGDTNPMSQHPTAILPVFDRRKQEMHIWPDPAVERVSVLTELLGARVLDHVGVGEPVLIRNSCSMLQTKPKKIRTKLGKPHTHWTWVCRRSPGRVL
jgi:hypothetical protein